MSDPTGRPPSGSDTSPVLALPTLPSASRPSAPVLALISAAWLGPAILAVFNSCMQAKLANEPTPSPRVLAWQGGDWLLYGALTPVVFHLARRFPLRRGVLLCHLGLHFAASLVLCAAWAGAGVVLRALLIPGPEGVATSQFAVSWFFTTLPFGVAVYFAVLGVEHATYYFHAVRERETHGARLSAQLAEARLSALRMQLHPHFLFNSLNAIGVLVRDQDTAAASRMVELLSDVLRQVLAADQLQETSLGAEIAFLKNYLAIEQVRFSDRLRPVFDIEPATLQAAVPTFILQPIVENALRHGIAKRTDAGALRISARRVHDDLVVTVHDDGPGPAGPGAGARGGVGLMNTRARLDTQYGGRASFELAPGAAGGAIATLRLPFREITSDRARDDHE